MIATSIMNAGDEIVRCAMRRPPPPSAGWVRDFVIAGDGWIKDGDYKLQLLEKRCCLIRTMRDADYDAPAGAA